jgi:uncharacterized protein involved in outer membrane biogenesis
MKYIFRTIKWLLIPGLILIAVAVVFLLTFDANKYKPEIEQFVQEKTGRALVLNGKLELKLSLSPYFLAEDVSFANAGGAKNPQMLRLKSLEAAVDILPLFSGTVHVRRIALNAPEIYLEKNAKGAANWDFGDFDKPSGTESPKAKTDAPTQEGFIKRIEVNAVELRDLKLFYDDLQAKTAQRLEAERFTVSEQLDHRLAVILNTKYNGEAIELEGTLGSIDTLMTGDAPYPFALRVKAYGVQAEATGEAHSPLKLKTIDIASFKAEGRGHSASGALQIALQPRLAVSGKVAIPEIRLAALQEKSGAKPTGEPQTTQAKKSGERLFTATPLPFDLLQIADVDLNIEVGKLDLDKKGVDLSAIRAHPALKSGKLVLPVSFDVGQGKAQSTISLDSKTRAADLTLQAGFPKLASVLGSDISTEGGATKAEASLNARGASLAELMSHLDGKALITLDKTTLVTERLGEVLTKLLALATGKAPDKTLISCAVMNLQVHNGQIDLGRRVALESDVLSLSAMGEVNLAKETLNVSVIPMTPGGATTGVAALVSQLTKVSGALSAPTVTLDAQGLAQSAVGAALTQLASGGKLKDAKKLLSGTVEQDDHPCQTALAGGKIEKIETFRTDEPPATGATNDASSDKSRKPAKILKGLKGLFK